MAEAPPSAGDGGGGGPRRRANRRRQAPQATLMRAAAACAGRGARGAAFVGGGARADGAQPRAARARAGQAPAPAARRPRPPRRRAGAAPAGTRAEARGGRRRAAGRAGPGGAGHRASARISQALERQRARLDDIRRRLDELEARLHDKSGATTRSPTAASGETSVSPVPRRRLRDPLAGRPLPAASRACACRRSTWASSRRRGPMDTAAARIVRRSRSRTPRSSWRGTRAAGVRVPTAVRRRRVAGGQRRVRAVALHAQRSAVRVGQFKVPYGLPAPDLERPSSSSSTSRRRWRRSRSSRDLGLMVLGRPLAGRLQYEFAVLNGAGAGQPNDNLDLAYAARVVAAPFGPLPPGEGDIEWHHAPAAASLGVAGYYNLIPTDIRLRTNNPTANIDHEQRRAHRQRRDLAGGLRAARAVARGRAAGRVVRARRRPRRRRVRRAATGAATCRRATSCFRGRLQVAGAPRPHGRCRSTAPPPTNSVRRGTRIDEQSVAVSSYLRGQPRSSCRSTTATCTPGATTGLASMPPDHPPRARRRPAGVLTETNLRAAAGVTPAPGLDSH